MRLEMDDMDKIYLADHSDADETIIIEKEGTKYIISINRKMKSNVVLEDISIEPI